MSEVLNFYNYLHTIPEEGFQEFKTSAFLLVFMIVVILVL